MDTYQARNNHACMQIAKTIGTRCRLVVAKDKNGRECTRNDCRWGKVTLQGCSSEAAGVFGTHMREWSVAPRVSNETQIDRSQMGKDEQHDNIAAVLWHS
jgi:hypothetical protein